MLIANARNAAAWTGAEPTGAFNVRYGGARVPELAASLLDRPGEYEQSRRLPTRADADALVAEILGALSALHPEARPHARRTLEYYDGDECVFRIQVAAHTAYDDACAALDGAPTAQLAEGTLVFSDEPGRGLIVVDADQASVIVASSLSSDAQHGAALYEKLSHAMAALPAPAPTNVARFADAIAIFPAACDATRIGNQTWKEPFAAGAHRSLSASSVVELSWPDQAAPIGALVRLQPGELSCAYQEYVDLGDVTAGHVLWLTRKR